MSDDKTIKKEPDRISTSLSFSADTLRALEAYRAKETTAFGKPAMSRVVEALLRRELGLADAGSADNG